MDLWHLHIRVTGRVQGVNYRGYVQHFAFQNDLSGRVWNNTDGTVELIAEGPKTKILKLLEACHIGPSLAHVTRIQTLRSESISKTQFSDFQIERPVSK